jgi:hypothetical protein
MYKSDHNGNSPNFSSTGVSSFFYTKSFTQEITLPTGHVDNFKNSLLPYLEPFPDFIALSGDMLRYRSKPANNRCFGDKTFPEYLVYIYVGPNANSATKKAFEDLPYYADVIGNNELADVNYRCLSIK